MTILEEGNLQISIPSGVSARKFDNDAHGLSHCMKAVDFIVELKDRYLYIEFKDPQHPKAQSESRKEFLDKYLAGKSDDVFVHKYRDSFLYSWAMHKADKPIYYYVLVAMDSLSKAELSIRTDELKRRLPIGGPKSGLWKRMIVSGCAVFNIATWNENVPSYPVSRMTP